MGFEPTTSSQRNVVRFVCEKLSPLKVLHRHKMEAASKPVSIESPLETTGVSLDAHVKKGKVQTLHLLDFLVHCVMLFFRLMGAGEHL